jgi:hypothetical protein
MLHSVQYSAVAAQHQIHTSSEEKSRITAALENAHSVSAGMSAQLRCRLSPTNSWRTGRQHNTTTVALVAAPARVLAAVAGVALTSTRF